MGRFFQQTSGSPEESIVHMTYGIKLSVWDWETFMFSPWRTVINFFIIKEIIYSERGKLSEAIT